MDQYLKQFLDGYKSLKKMVDMREDITNNDVHYVVQKSMKTYYYKLISHPVINPPIHSFVFDLHLISSTYNQHDTFLDMSKKLKTFIEEYDLKYKPLHIFFASNENKQKEFYILVKEKYVSYIQLIDNSLIIYYADYVKTFNPDTLECKSYVWIDISNKNKNMNIIFLKEFLEMVNSQSSQPKSQLRIHDIKEDNMVDILKKFSKYSLQEIYSIIHEMIENKNAKQSKHSRSRSKTMRK